MEQDFRYGPLAQGLYMTLLWLTVLLGFVAPTLLPWHIALLLFLGLGLKPLLLKSGAHALYRNWSARMQQRAAAGHHAQAARDIDRKRRDDRFRKSRLRHPDLPPGW